MPKENRGVETIEEVKVKYDNREITPEKYHTHGNPEIVVYKNNVLGIYDGGHEQAIISIEKLKEIIKEVENNGRSTNKI